MQTNNMPKEVVLVMACAEGYALVRFNREADTICRIKCIMPFRDLLIAGTEAVQINFSLGWNAVTLSSVVGHSVYPK